MTRTTPVFVVFLLACGLLAACGRQGPTSPDGQLSGAWSGAITGSPSGAGTAKLVLTQNGAGLAGTFTVTWPDAAQNRTGVASGTATGGVATIAMTPTTPLSCPGSLTLTGTMTATVAIGSGRLTGSYSSLACGGAQSGTLDLAKD
jgi:hypothetical protein